MTTLIPSIVIPLEDLVSNLSGAHTYATAYFLLEIASSAPPQDLVHVIDYAHSYLSAYIEGLQAHDLWDLEYSIALHLELCKLTAKVPPARQQAHWHVWAVSQEERTRCSFTYDVALLLPGEKGYVEHSPRCVPHRLLWPSRKLPKPAAPVRVSNTPLPSKQSKVAAPSPSGSTHRPHPTMIKTPQSGSVNSFAEYMVAYSAHEAHAKVKPTFGANTLSPREPCKTVSVSIPKKASAPSSLKQKSVQSPSPEHYDDYLFDDEALTAPRKRALFSPPFDHSDSDIDQPPPPKKLKPALSVSSIPRAYHALTGKPLNGLLYTPLAAPVAPAPPLPTSPAKGKPPVVTLLLPIVDAPATSTRSKSRAPAKEKKANVHANTTCQTAARRAADKAAASKKLGDQAMPSGRARKGVKPAAAATATKLATPPVTEAQPVASGSGHVKTPPHQDPVDHTMYAHMFDPQINLCFHEPTSRHALERLQWSALPPAPASLLEPTTQGNRTAIFGVHSDVDVHLLRIPHLFWPCFNCSIGGHPELCEYEEGAEPGKEACLHCQANRHGQCSACMDAHDFHRVATLLDPLVQSGDPAIYDGLRRAERIEKDINALYNVIVNCMLECNEVLHGLVNGLDAIATHEGGTAIIDQYAEASELIWSLIVEVGKFSGGSEAE
ncbi:hypothetical protein EDD85DRAFT_795715 [Armillaria nabsnona]|nr:hypothetical protein EDD85DRAFT_795715 [Armillaria nabsnona]